MCARLRERTTVLVTICISDEKLTILALTPPFVSLGNNAILPSSTRGQANGRSFPKSTTTNKSENPNMNNDEMNMPPRHQWIRPASEFLHKKEYTIDPSIISKLPDAEQRLIRYIQGWYKALLRMKKLEAVCEGVDLFAPIYRTMSWDRFMTMLQTKQLTLRHPTDWDDPWENFLLRSDAYLKDGTPCSLKSIADTYYAQCWSFNAESEALWRRYADITRRAVKIRTTAGKLMAEIYPFNSELAPLQFFFRKVQYVSAETLEEFKQSMGDCHISNWSNQFLESLCLKRKAFSYEDEVRLIYQETESSSPPKPTPEVKTIPADPTRFIEEVVVDPWCSEQERMNLETAISGLYSGSLQRSQLLDGSDTVVVI